MDELPPSARALLDLARDADDPSPDQRARSDEALRAALARRGIQQLPQLAPWGAAHAGFGPRGVFAAKAGAVALVVIGAAYLGARSLRSESRAVTASQPTAAETAAPALDARPAPVIEPSVSSPEAAREPELRAPANAAHRPDARRAPRTVHDSLAGELRTIAAVDALVRQQRFNDALQMLEHTESESAAVLHEERAALRILARCGIDPSARALREREQFLRASPRSVLAERVRKACTRLALEAL